MFKNSDPDSKKTNCVTWILRFSQPWLFTLWFSVLRCHVVGQVFFSCSTLAPACQATRRQNTENRNRDAYRTKTYDGLHCTQKSLKVTPHVDRGARKGIAMHYRVEVNIRARPFLHSWFSCGSRMTVAAGRRRTHWLDTASAWYEPYREYAEWGEKGTDWVHDTTNEISGRSTRVLDFLLQRPISENSPLKG